MAEQNVITQTTKGKSNDLMAVPDNWLNLTSDRAAKEALRPIKSFASVLRADDTLVEVCNIDSCLVLEALVERAEVILGIPGGSI